METADLFKKDVSVYCYAGMRSGEFFENKYSELRGVKNVERHQVETGTTGWCSGFRSAVR